eukprot:600758-Amorphochlora_amoeboformis.AAC.1
MRTWSISPSVLSLKRLVCGMRSASLPLRAYTPSLRVLLHKLKLLRTVSSLTNELARCSMDMRSSTESYGARSSRYFGGVRFLFFFGTLPPNLARSWFYKTRFSVNMYAI